MNEAVLATRVWGSNPTYSVFVEQACSYCVMCVTSQYSGFFAQSKEMLFPRSACIPCIGQVLNPQSVIYLLYLYSTVLTAGFTVIVIASNYRHFKRYNKFKISTKAIIKCG